MKNKTEAKKRLGEEVVLEGYSRKKELEGIIPEEEVNLHENPIEKGKREEEELFINSVGDVNFDDEDLMKD